MTDSYYRMSDTCATCGERYGQHYGMSCPDKAGQFVLAAEPTSAPGSYHYPVALDDYFTRAAEQANRLVFPSGAAVLTSGDKIVGRVEAEPEYAVSGTYSAKRPSGVTVTILGGGGSGGVSMTPTLDKLETGERFEIPPAPLPHFNQRTEFDPFPDYVVFHEFEPVAPLHTSPATQGAYPAIAGLLRG